MNKDNVFAIWVLVNLFLSPLGFWFGGWCAENNIHPLIGLWMVLMFFGAPMFWRLAMLIREGDQK